MAEKRGNGAPVVHFWLGPAARVVACGMDCFRHKPIMTVDRRAVNCKNCLRWLRCREQKAADRAAMSIYFVG